MISDGIVIDSKALFGRDEKGRGWNEDGGVNYFHLFGSLMKSQVEWKMDWKYVSPTRKFTLQMWSENQVKTGKKNLLPKLTLY